MTYRSERIDSEQRDLRRRRLRAGQCSGRGGQTRQALSGEPWRGRILSDRWPSTARIFAHPAQVDDHRRRPIGAGDRTPDEACIAALNKDRNAVLAAKPDSVRDLLCIGRECHADGIAPVPSTSVLEKRLHIRLLDKQTSLAERGAKRCQQHRDGCFGAIASDRHHVLQ